MGQITTVAELITVLMDYPGGMPVLVLDEMDEPAEIEVKMVHVHANNPLRLANDEGVGFITALRLG